MVDELMLRDVKNILSKIEVVRARDDFSELLIKIGVSSESSIDEINEAIVAAMMSEHEVKLYRKYLLYRKKTDLINLSSAIDVVSNITDSVSSNYDLRSRNSGTIGAINDEIEKIDFVLRDVNRICIGTEYAKVKGSYKTYYDAYIKSGMDRYTYVEQIESIEHSSKLGRRLKKGKLSKLQQGLEEFNIDAKNNIDDLFQRHLEAKDSYRAYLVILMMELMLKNKVLYNAGLLTLRSMYGDEIPVKILDNGVIVVDDSSKIDIHPKTIAEKAFEYFQSVDEPEFDADMFMKCFRDFLIHSYNQELARLDEENDKSLTSIKKHFDKQKEVVGTLLGLQNGIQVETTQINKDEEDTFALVYTDTRYNK